MLPYTVPPPFRNTRLGMLLKVTLSLFVLAGAAYLVLSHIDDHTEQASSAPAPDMLYTITPPEAPAVRQLHPSSTVPSGVVETVPGSFACSDYAASITIESDTTVEHDGTIITMSTNLEPAPDAALTFNDWSLFGDVSLIVNTSLDGQRLTPIGQVTLNETDVLQLHVADFTSGTITSITLCVGPPTPPMTTTPPSTTTGPKSQYDMPITPPPVTLPPVSATP